jgi:3-oxoacyl-[acyl-carrier protein] reductase
MIANNRVIIVTGGSRGLGLGIVQQLLDQGHPIVTCSRSKTTEIESLEGRHSERFLWLPCDAGDQSQEEAFFSKTMDWIGDWRLYGLVNNAGIAGEGILATFPTTDCEHILSVNLLSALRLSRLAMRVLLAGPPGGRIINISSIVGLRGYTGLAAYSASKAGMDGFTRSLAREVGRRLITVNSIAPGYLETALSASLGEQQRRQIINRTPLGRLGKVSDVVPMVSFLISDEGGFITGQTLVIDGGISS